MTIDGLQRGANRRTGRFFLWGWLMLAVVLLSAAPTGGQPRTRSVGSAFDPASLSVVVRPGKSRTVAVAAPLDKRKAPDTQSGSAPAVSIPALAHAPAAPTWQGAWPQSVAPAVPERRISWPAHGPRAPPAA